jgi:hypothetical protein
MRALDASCLAALALLAATTLARGQSGRAPEELRRTPCVMEQPSFALGESTRLGDEQLRALLSGATLVFLRKSELRARGYRHYWWERRQAYTFREDGSFFNVCTIRDQQGGPFKACPTRDLPRNVKGDRGVGTWRIEARQLCLESVDEGRICLAIHRQAAQLFAQGPARRNCFHGPVEADRAPRT